MRLNNEIEIQCRLLILIFLTEYVNGYLLSITSYLPPSLSPSLTHIPSLLLSLHPLSLPPFSPPSFLPLSLIHSLPASFPLPPSIKDCMFELVLQQQIVQCSLTDHSQDPTTIIAYDH